MPATSGEACDNAGYSRSAVYRYREEDIEFRRAWCEAYERAVERLEADADQRAIGVETPVYHKDKVIGRRVRYSDSLLLARLRVMAPDRYVRHEPLEVTERKRGENIAGIPPKPTRPRSRDIVIYADER